MLSLKSIIFEDEDGNNISVAIDGEVTADKRITIDCVLTAKLYTNLILVGGYNALLDYIGLKK